MQNGLALFREEAISHRRRRVDGAVFLACPVGPTLVTFTLIAMIAITIVFLSGFEFQRKETVSGYITSSAGVVALRGKNGGILSELFVEVGDSVNAGDPLFAAITDLESTAGLTRDRQIAVSDESLQELSEQSALISKTFVTRRASLQHKRQATLGLIERLSEQAVLKQQVLELSEQRLQRVRTLSESQHVAAQEVAGQLERVLEHRAGLAALQLGIADRRNDIRDVTFELDSLPFAEARDLSELQVRRNSLQQAQLEQKAQRDYLVRSPVSGRVSAIQGHVGQELSAQTAVVTVLPEGARLVANLLAPSRAAGFLQVNGPVNLLIDAFPYQKFGVQRGILREIAKTAQTADKFGRPFAHDGAVYKLVVELDRDYVIAYGRKHRLAVDMTLRGDLIVDRRSLLDWLLEPLRSVRL